MVAVIAELLELDRQADVLTKILASKVVQNDDDDGAGAGTTPGKGIKTVPALGLHRRPRPFLHGLHLHARPQCDRTGKRSSRTSKGYLQADAYSGYDGLYKLRRDRREVGCT